MKKLLMMMALSMACASVFADDLAQADKLFEQNQFPQALQIYTKLANGGNAEAQQKLGDMYWYGEAGAVDQAQAEIWFRKAAEKGSDKARQTLELMQKRAARLSEIEYYTTRFDGGAQQFAKAGCVKPVIPPLSKTNTDIKRVNAEMQTWTDCYNRFVAQLSTALPAGKTIPPDLEKVMSNDDLARAVALMDKAFSAQAADARQQVAAVNEEHQRWAQATRTWVADSNKATEQLKAQIAEMDAIREHSMQIQQRMESINPRGGAGVGPSTR